MADYSSKAQIIVTVNGKQAEKMMNDLQKRAEILRKKMDEAAKIGDKGTVQKLSRELKQVERQINQIKGASQSVEEVLKRLDKASPRELKKTLSQLQKQLEGIEKGSDAWKTHMQKIKSVKDELSRLNSEMSRQQSGWDRMNNWLNNTQTFLLGVAAGITGLIMAGRKAVNAFAEMDEQLANTRKYTGMAADDVEKLNEAFKHMDTRTPREKLNELAQEAGRLGLNTLDSVKEYVEAADIINVALVDLGAGATQTIAKLTNIFGVQEMLGTKQSMLAVGSAVNVLSQNCTASKPYLVEFAQRMAGIGSQAGLTIPQILAFGAVLDANGQKVEMSATAIQKVIMNLANKNQEFAKTVGIDAEKLNETLKHSAKDGLLMFLEALQKMGQSVGFENATLTLAPAFKEMGLDAARVSQVLSTLAMHLDEVKWQMGEADKAFAQATSATKEYEIFNSTAQASIDKAKKRVTELAIELGEKLYPVMSHIYTSSGVFLRVLNQLVSFVIKYKTEIITVVSALVTYNAVLLISATRTKMVTTATLLWNSALKFMSGVVPALKLLFAGLANSIQYFTNGLRVNYAMQQRWQTAMAGMKLANWTGLIVAAAAAVFLLAKRFMEAKTTAEELAEARKKIEDQTAEETKSEISRLELLYAKTQDQTAAMDERLTAVKRMRELYPDYFKDLSDEAILAGQAADAYEKLKDNILETARARYRDSRIAELEGQINELQSQYDKQAKPFMQQSVNARLNAGNDQKKLESDPDYKLAEWSLKVLKEKYLDQIDELKREQESLATKNLAFEIANMKLKEESDNNDFGGIGDIDPEADSKTDSKAEDKFKEEKEWREKQEALARIAYATGKSDYIKYCKEMDEIAVQYQAALLAHEELTDLEKTKIYADYTEAMKKREERFHAESIEAESARYNEALAKLKQYFIDGKVSQKAYDDFTIEVEAEHQQNLINLYEEGSKERLQAEEKLRSMMVSATQKRIKESERLEKEYASVKAEFFGDNPQERKAKFDSALDALKVVYKREIQAAGDNAQEKLRIEEAFEQAKLALKKKYGLLAEAEERNALRSAVNSSVEWLNSDGGKAVLDSIQTISSGMSSIFSQLTDLVKSELEIQTAEIEKRYEKEVSRAEGNTYQIAQLEKQKEAEIAKAKNEANKKMYGMQVMQAIAQTAMGAINAYSSAAAVPIVGYILAPIAAAMAVAAGMAQVANIKKQQEASASAGYAEGGFTIDGDKYQPAGIVHAGEWVASQKLVKNPRVRPILNALEYSQRNNVEPMMSMEDVSMRLTAPTIVAHGGASSGGSNKLLEVVEKLNKRLDDPFYSITEMAGDHGAVKARNRYDRLMKNKG